MYWMSQWVAYRLDVFVHDIDQLDGPGTQIEYSPGRTVSSNPANRPAKQIESGAYPWGGSAYWGYVHVGTLNYENLLTGGVRFRPNSFHIFTTYTAVIRCGICLLQCIFQKKPPNHWEIRCSLCIPWIWAGFGGKVFNFVVFTYWMYTKEVDAQGPTWWTNAMCKDVFIA